MSDSLFIFACFYNEVSVLPYALQQLKDLGATEIHVADGCFDRKFPQHSSDGTYEALQEFAETHDHVVLHDVVRASQIAHVIRELAWILKRWSPRRIPYVRRVGRLIQTNNYRVNQSATFNTMLAKSGAKRPTDWIMTVDADEFYDNRALTTLENLHEYTKVVPFNERTFVGSLAHEAVNYSTTPLRYWNVPHRYESDMRFLPPRLIVWPEKTKRWPFVGYSLSSAPRRGVEPAGTIYHYKQFDKARNELAYHLGDRKPPESRRMKTRDSEAVHPEIARRAYGSRESS